MPDSDSEDVPDATGPASVEEEGPGGWSGFRTGAALGIALVVGFVGGRFVDSPIPRAEPAEQAAGAGAAEQAGAAGTAASTARAAPTPDSVFYVTGAPTHQHGTASGGGDTAGLARSAGGLSLDSGTTAFEADRRQAFRFRVVAAGGAPVTSYPTVHERPLHLVVIRRDLTGFQHLHPTMAPDGTWSVDLTLPKPGTYRAIADFTAIVGGQPLPVSLGVDLTVAGGRMVPVPLPPPATRVETDGLAVRLDGAPTAGRESELTIQVTARDGSPAKLEPYLGAAAHLIAFSEGDVAYLHTHAEVGAARFRWTPPGPGRYRLFAEFQLAGRVHVAAFTTQVR
ncbi:hypothetical protein Q0Z83_048540 [Actinoplanes sichuanensis]|uniref:Secreted protein n=1 Tax=Actinoplanes sichuanensis TaxID=512349 RepID=A0ABW4AQ84_9ACTN|nr:hypothetical protein [Actinoplanes sichuanensis]BEL06663.1 hypothetical protein Q0Z83_048540 [Actinoplanes sichuanensis]